MKPLCRLDDIPAGGGLEMALDASQAPRHLALFRHGGQIRVYVNACPHQGRNLAYAPNEFLFNPDGALICPHHGACFDLATGECLEGPCQGAALTSIEIVVRDGTVYLGGNGPREEGER